MNIIELLENLEHGVGKPEGKNNIVRGHKNNSLDVIMAPKPIEWVKSVAHRLCDGGAHALTVTFTDTYLFKYKERYLLSEVGKVMKGTRGVIGYILCNDISKSGRFHLHGVVKFKDIKVITNLRRKLSTFGISKVKVIDNSPKWVDYMTQQFTPEGKQGIKIPIEGLLYLTN